MHITSLCYVAYIWFKLYIFFIVMPQVTEDIQVIAMSWKIMVYHDVTSMKSQSVMSWRRMVIHQHSCVNWTLTRHNHVADDLWYKNNKQLSLSVVSKVYGFLYDLKEAHWPFCSERCVRPTRAWPPSWRSALTSPSPGHWWTNPCEPCMQQSPSPLLPLNLKILWQTLD